MSSTDIGRQRRSGGVFRNEQAREEAEEAKLWSPECLVCWYGLSAATPSGEWNGGTSTVNFTIVEELTTLASAVLSLLRLGCNLHPCACKSVRKAQVAPESCSSSAVPRMCALRGRKCFFFAQPAAGSCRPQRTVCCEQPWTLISVTFV